MLITSVYAQTAPVSVSALTDSLRLPFAIADEKRLSDEDLADKREGRYITGVPELSADPINGFGYGIEAEFFVNGKRSDPFFAYTPYRSRLGLTLFNTTRNQREININYDVPYAFNSKWRLRLEAAYEVNPNLLYFGVTPASLSPLVHPTTGQLFSRFDAYQAALDQTRPAAAGLVTDHYYDGYRKEEAILNISGERVYAEGKVRLLIGFETALFKASTFDGTSYSKAIDPVTATDITVPNGPTRLKQDVDAGRVRGLAPTSSISFRPESYTIPAIWKRIRAGAVLWN